MQYILKGNLNNHKSHNVRVCNFGTVFSHLCRDVFASLLSCCLSFLPYFRDVPDPHHAAKRVQPFTRCTHCITSSGKVSENVQLAAPTQTFQQHFAAAQTASEHIGDRLQSSSLYIRRLFNIKRRPGPRGAARHSPRPRFRVCSHRELSTSWKAQTSLQSSAAIGQKPGSAVTVVWR